MIRTLVHPFGVDRRPAPTPITTTSVLCFYSYIGRVPTGLRRYHGALMIRVTRSELIPLVFDLLMRRRIERWNALCVGPKPLTYRFEAYLPHNGLRSFG
jgi:hypothetical protein